MACVVVLAALLDAWDRPVPGGPVLWLDLAALLTVGWALLEPGAVWKLDGWLTPYDGRVFAGLALAMLTVIATPGSASHAALLHQLLPAGACYYAFTGRLRHDARGPDVLWLPFGIAAAGLGVLVLGAFLRGPLAFAQATAAADAAWAAQDGLGKALVFATVTSAGRAVERAAGPAWRIAALLGAAGCVACGLAGGIPLDTHALARLDEPMYFSTTAVTLLLLVPLTRSAWLLRRERPHEAGRWGALSLGFAMVALITVLGESTGGEGLRLLAVLGGAAVVTGHDAPMPAAAAPEGAAQADPPPLARAA